MESDPAKSELQWGLRIPMRDGVCLSATLYRPQSQQAPAPALFTLTPYTAQTYHDVARRFAAQGFPFLTVDVRGRGNSDGAFEPFVNEAHDGFDVVQWLAQQPYCNGKVAMWGGSYAGYDQWATAKERPKHLATIVPVASVHPGVDFPARNNIFTPYILQWLMYVSGRTLQDKIITDSPLWSDLYQQHFQNGAAFGELGAFLGTGNATFKKWISHPTQDPYWDRCNPTAEQYQKLRIPILTITGIYDGDQQGALTYYRRHLQQVAPAGYDSHYLVIGPWDHAGTRNPQLEFSGIKVGPDSLLDLHELHRQWYTWTLQDGPRPTFLQNKVAYYVMGHEHWRYAESLEKITQRHETLYLDWRENPNDVFSAGALSTTPTKPTAPTHYIYDPRDTHNAALESSVDPTDVTDQRMILAATGSQWIFHSTPFATDRDICGFFKCRLHLSIDQPDTDFRVSVYEIDVSGASVLLSTDSIRARYRQNLRQATLIDTVEPIHYTFERFNFVARKIKRRSRLRLVIGPINSIYAEKNHNTGSVIAEDSIQTSHPVKVALMHDESCPNTLSVPMGD